MELASKVLATLMGQSFTPESAETSALAINFLHRLKKNDEDEIRGNGVGKQHPVYTVRVGQSFTPGSTKYIYI